MNPLLVMTHLIAAGLGLLASLIFKSKPQIALKETKVMPNGFVSLLDHIGDGLKKFFTSPIVADLENVGISIAEVAWPGITPLLSAVQASLAKAQALAAAANVAGDTTAQVAALTLADAQAAFTAYEQASGTTLETAQQQKIIQLVLQLLGSLPAPTSTASAPAAPVASAAPAAPAPVAEVAAAQPGPGLAAVTAQ